MSDVFDMEDRKCLTCASHEDGRCHKNAPTLVDTEGFGIFPRVHPNRGWCTEYVLTIKGTLHSF